MAVTCAHVDVRIGPDSGAGGGADGCANRGAFTAMGRRTANGSACTRAHDRAANRILRVRGERRKRQRRKSRCRQNCLPHKLPPLLNGHFA